MTFYLIPISGANQLLWYYADMEKQRCYAQEEEIDEDQNVDLDSYQGGFANVTIGPMPQPGVIQHDINHCLAWRRFAK